MFEAKCRNIAIFRQLINTVDKTVNLLNFSCDINGMSMESMNEAKCIYISMFWPKSEFQKYNCDKKTGWTIDAKILSKTLKMSELDSETCILKLTDDNPDEILVEFNNAQSGLVRKVYMKLMEHEDIYFPAFSNVDIKFIIDSKDFQQEIAKMISCKKVQIQATENSVIFKGKTDLQRIHVEFPLHSNHSNDTSLEVMDSYFRDNNSLGNDSHKVWRYTT
ncbi:hypothetical protein CRE_03403 [Caenorhabditis remanei]|uniref:Uncharacterized protein n=1 Tax=Caenorhabditis remanei TaxID=31234 RepID=E3NAL8_CAERE|nr:hypothetical protein CRE_03403 [Caenorhabditis remanei]